jgi:hypothetical protein
MSQTNPHIHFTNPNRVFNHSPEMIGRKPIERDVQAFAIYAFMLVLQCGLTVYYAVTTLVSLERSTLKEIAFAIRVVLDIITIGTLTLAAFKKTWLLTGWAPLKLSPLVLGDLLGIMADAILLLKFNLMSVRISLYAFVYYELAFSDAFLPYRYPKVAAPDRDYYKASVIEFDLLSVKKEDMDAVASWLSERNLEVTEYVLNDDDSYIVALLYLVPGSEADLLLFGKDNNIPMTQIYPNIDRFD